MENPIPPDRPKQYAALVKCGDAVETPDGELWVVEALTADGLALASAYRGRDGEIVADRYEVTRTVVAAELVTKVADVRQVRR